MRMTQLGSWAVFAIAALSTGCATVKTHDPRDPWEGFNRNVQTFNDKVDAYVMKPVAKGYQWVMPGFADQGVSNFFNNLDDISVTTNDLLQGKFKQSGMDGGRFLVNSSVGVAGLVDVASMIDLPKHNEDFDQTMGVWGIPSGPYIVLPFFGPSSPRGVVGLVGDAAMNPITYAGFYVNPSWVGSAISTGLGAVKAVDNRADLLSAEKVAEEAALDRYDFYKNAYLSRREYLIKDGNVPEEDVLKFDQEQDKGYGPINPY